MATREGRWNCKNCQKVNLGRNVDCEGCGRGRPADTIFYLPEDAPPVTDPKLLAQAASGPDNHCAYCDGIMINMKCPKCGSVEVECEPVLTRGNSYYDVLTFPASSFKEKRASPSNVYVQQAVAEPDSLQDYATKMRGMFYWMLGLGGFVVAALLFYFLAFGTRTAKLQSKSWNRSIAVESIRTFKESAWQNQVPSGARRTNSYTATRGYNRVRSGTDIRYKTVTDRVQTGSYRKKVGTRNKGNGFFEDVYEDVPTYRYVERQEAYEVPIYIDVPVFDTKVEYDIDRWTVVRNINSQGTDTLPEWPSSNNLRPDERAGQQTENYSAVFVDSKNEVHNKTVSGNQYTQLNKQTVYKLNTAFGSVTSFQTLEAEKSE